MKKCVFAGTFDPPTKGHRQIIDNCLKIFDEVVVAVMVNTAKAPLFTVAEREGLLKKLFVGAGKHALLRSRRQKHGRLRIRKRELVCKQKAKRRYYYDILSRRAGQSAHKLVAGQKFLRV